MKSFSIFTLFLFFASININAQDYVPTPDDIKHFPETKTIMVLEDSPLSEYNLIIQDRAPVEWNVTKIEFKEWKYFDEYKNNKGLSFLVLNRVTFDKDKTNARYLFLSLVLGGDAKKLASMPDICSVPLAYYDAPEDSYVYKVDIFLRFIQNHIKVISDNPKIVGKSVVTYYNSNIQPLKGKTLYLLANELGKDVNTEAKIKKVYSGPVKIVTKDVLAQAIADKDPNVVFLHKVGPHKKIENARCYKVLIGAADAQFYYFDYHKINAKAPDGFLANDFIKFGKQVAKQK